MTLKKALEKVYETRNTQNRGNKEYNYSSAEKRFKKIMSYYNLDEKYLKKANQEDANYDFTDKDIEFISFVYSIYDMDPAPRKNSKDENFNLDNYKKIYDYIQDSIKNKSYPSIQYALSESVSTAEFCSIDLLNNLSDKITKVLAFACENNHVDYTIYNDLNTYLNTLLYTYSNHNKVYELVKGWYPEPFFRTAKMNSDNKNVSFDRMDGSTDHIKTYQGVSAYLLRLFTDIYNPILNESENSNDDDIPNEKNTLIINYDFENIDSLNDFLHYYVEIKHNTLRKTYKFIELEDDDLPTEIIRFAYNSMINKIEDSIEGHEEIINNDIAVFLTSISMALKSKNPPELDRIYCECNKLLLEFNQKIVHFLSPNSRWIELSISYVICSLRNEIKYFYDNYCSCLNLTDDIVDMNTIKLFYKTLYFISKLILTFELYLYNPNNLCTCQINYKGFKMHLNMIFDPYPSMENPETINEIMYNSFHTPEKAINRINDLIAALTKTEEEIKSFNQSDIDKINTKRSELHVTINEAIGAYFRDVNLIEQLKKQSKRK